MPKNTRRDKMTCGGWRGVPQRTEVCTEIYKTLAFKRTYMKQRGVSRGIYLHLQNALKPQRRYRNDTDEYKYPSVAYKVSFHASSQI